MQNSGFISAQVFTSNAKIPIAGASVAFFRKTASAAELIAFRITNEDGFTDFVEVQTPNLDSADESTSGLAPFAQISVLVDMPGYDRIFVENAQIFTNIRSMQPLQLIPTAVLAPSFGTVQVYPIPPQTL